LYAIARYYSTRYYSECFDHERAKKLYLRLIELYPESRYSSYARIEIPALDIKENVSMGVPELSQIELRKFKDNYEKSLFLARKCYDIANYCLEERYDITAIEILEMVVREFPDFYYYHTRAKLSLDVAKICQKIKDGNLPDAREDITKLKQNYAGYYYLPGQLYFIAGTYSFYGHNNLSYFICDEIIKEKGENKYAEYARVNQYRLNISSRLQAEDLEGAKELLKQFKSEKEKSFSLYEGLLILTEEFYAKAMQTEDESIKRGYLSVVINICKDDNILENPSGEVRSREYMLLGSAYLNMGDFRASIGYFQKLINEHPQGRYSWVAQFMIAQTYERMAAEN
jgi:hypothetical protein